MNRMEQVIRRGIAALNKVSRRPMPDRVTELSPLEVALETALGIRGRNTHRSLLIYAGLPSAQPPHMPIRTHVLGS